MTAKHTYPSKYRPGSQWSTTLAWGILDQLPPGVMWVNVRYLLAGLFAGAITEIVQLAKDGQMPPRASGTEVALPDENIAARIQIDGAASEIARRVHDELTSLDNKYTQHDTLLPRTILKHATAVLTELAKLKHT